MKNNINSRSARQSARKYMPYAMALFIAVGCNTPEEKNPQPQEKIEIVKPKPKMDTLDIGNGLGNIVFKDTRLQAIHTPKDVQKGEQMGKVILGTNGKLYIFAMPNRKPEKMPPVLEIDGQKIQFINNHLAVVMSDSTAHLADISLGETPAETKGPEIKSFVSIQDNMISEPKNIDRLGIYGIQGQSIVFMTPDNKKIFYGNRTNAGLDQLIEIQNLTIEKNYFSLQTNKGKIYYDGNQQGWSNDKSIYFLEYDNIIDREDINEYDQHKKFVIKDGNIVNFETHQVQNFLQARKNGKLITITYPKQAEEEKNSTTLSEVLENHQEQPLGPIRTNVTDKFKNFKIQYIGISYGEGEYYSFSHDGKTFYNFENKDESGNLIINEGLSADAFDEIVSVHPLPKQMLTSKALTGSYQTQPTDLLHYVGANNGFEETVYTIQGASGTYVQKGDEVMEYLNKEYRYTIQNAQSGGYNFIGYFIQEGNKKVEVTPTTPCPKGTKIYFRYKKTNQEQ